MRFDRRLDSSWWALRLALGVVPFVAGLDKFFNLLTNWETYLNPLAPRILHVDPKTFMHVAGVVEMIVGVAMLTRWTRPAAYVASVWLLCIALNLLTMGRFLDVAARDVVIAIAAFALARITEARDEQAGSTQPARTTAFDARGIRAA